MRARTALARASHRLSTRVAPTYGYEGAFFLGAHPARGRVALAAKDFATDDALVVEAPLVQHRTVANVGARCDACLRRTVRGERFCSSACASSAWARYEEERGVDLREAEAYCRAAGVKFPLVIARAASMIASGSTALRGKLDNLVAAAGAGENPPEVWLEERALLRRAFANAREALDVLTPEWYARTASRLRLNSFRVEIPVEADELSGGVDFRALMASGLDAIARGGASGTAAYSASSYFNHSCAPNAHPRWENGDSTITIRALRPITAGEELFITYVDANESRESRRARLRQSYGFECACERCLAGE